MKDSANIIALFLGATVIFFSSSQPAKADILVRNLYPSLNAQDVAELFSNYGIVRRVYLPMEREMGRHRGFAFVTMSTESEE